MYALAELILFFSVGNRDNCRENRQKSVGGISDKGGVALPTTDPLTTNLLTIDLLTTDLLTTDLPTTDLPTTDLPTTDLLTTDLLTTDLLTTDLLTTDLLTTDLPTTDLLFGITRRITAKAGMLEHGMECGMEVQIVTRSSHEIKITEVVAGCFSNGTRSRLHVLLCVPRKSPLI